MSEVELVRVVIDGRPVDVPRGEMIIESAKRVGIEIPHFCYHPRLSTNAGANCRMCLVEVSAPRKNPDGSVTVVKMPKPQTACSLPASDGMVIETETPTIVEARRGILEFLLINHPLDCPICDRGGECPLQNNTLHYGPPTTRYVEEKRHLDKAYPLSRHVVLDRERCIHCARCTRFASDVSGDAQLGFLKRGADMEIAPFQDTEFTSLFSGNVIELCPVGALLSRDYRFKARPWDLATQKSICTECSNGCNVKLDHRIGRVVRVNARLNESVNEEWTCDRGKFGMAYISSPERVRRPLIRKGDRFVESDWKDALALAADRLGAAKSRAAFLGGVRSSNEDLYAYERLFRGVLGCANLDHRLGPQFVPTATLVGALGHDGALPSIAGLELCRTIVVVGSDLAWEQPIVYLRVRKAWFRRGARVLELQPHGLAAHGANRVADFAVKSVSYGPGELLPALQGLVQAVGIDLETSSHDASREETADRFAGAFEGVVLEPPVAFLLGKDVAASEQLSAVAELCAAAARASGDGGYAALPATMLNEQGARDLGILPDTGPGYRFLENAGMNTREILAAAGRGEIEALWISGVDIANEYRGAEYARRNLEEAPFTVVTALTWNDTARMADIVLPVCSVAEYDGTYTNVEGRIQRFYKAYDPSCDAREEWRIAAAIAAYLGQPMPFTAWQDVLRAMAHELPSHADCLPEDLGEEGRLRERIASAPQSGGGR